MSWWKHLRWNLEDVADLPAFIKMAASLRRASSEGRETCAQWIADRARANPDRIAVSIEDETVRYRELDERTNRCANLLRQANIGRGDVVAIAMENSPAFLAAQLAAAKLGAIGALINYHQRGAALEHVLEASAARAILTDTACAKRVVAAAPAVPLWAAGDPGLASGVDSLDRVLETVSADPPPAIELRGRDPYLYIYTSGTTGYPKPAIIRHMRFTMAGIALSSLFGIGADDVVYAPLPLYHGESNFVGFAVALRNGGTFASRRSFSAGAFLDDVRRHRATMFVYVGELCRYLMAQPDGPSDRDHQLRVAAGAGLRSDIWKPFKQRFGIQHIYEMYGSTEGNLSLMNRKNKPGSVGRAHPFQHRVARLVRYDVARDELLRGPDGFLVECEDDEPGELLGKVGAGPMQYDGYVDRAASEQKLVRNAFRRGDAWFRSGDLLARDANGWFYFVDRIGDTFRWKGENVSTQQVEGVLAECRGIDQANVYGVRVGGADGRAGMAAIVPSPSEDFSATELYRHVTDRLPGYACPLFVRLTRQMDETGTLKLRKVDLRADGFDPGRCADPLYLRSDDDGTYAPLTDELYREIQSGERRV